jgi:hypothetical protein
LSQLNNFFQTKTSLSIHFDSNAVFHLLNAIAHQNGLDFTLTQNRDPALTEEFCSKPAAFAMANDTITENSLFLLGSNNHSHHVKCCSLHLKTPLEKLNADPLKLNSYVGNVKRKLAEIHEVHSDDIVIVLHTNGSNCIYFALPEGAIVVTITVYIIAFGDELIDYHDIPALSRLPVYQETLDPRWNRDFSDPSQVVKNTQRAGFPYYPPEGWMRFGLNVSGRFDDGDDTWLSHSNRSGEWAVAYHGTSYRNVKGILTEALCSGPNNAYGKGIYCTPLVVTAERYAKDTIKVKTKEGEKEYQYVFMCCVNVMNVCECEEEPCPNAENPEYTLHVTRNRTDQYRFVNENNGEYENIRAYGLLVREVRRDIGTSATVV